MSLFALQLQSLAASLPASAPKRDNAGRLKSIERGETTRAAILDAMTKTGSLMRTREIAAATGLSWEIVRKWCAKMAADGAIVRSGEYGRTHFGVKK